MISAGFLFFVLFPLIAALLLLVTSADWLRKLTVRVSALIVAVASLLLFAKISYSGPIQLQAETHWLSYLIMGIETILTAWVCTVSLRNRRYLPAGLCILQFLILGYFELSNGSALISQTPFYADQLSALMAVIVGVVGSLICVYALGYMKNFHQHHSEVQDKRKSFFFVLFAFLSAMFGIVFSNNLLYLYFFWEITTLCSFVLIGYTKTKEATDNSFRALTMNLAGGLAFAIAVVILFQTHQIIDLDRLIALRGAALIPVALLCFAGITKAAQMPFSSWLLGAMVAPTPTSALLHSSTMVKAGVFLILKMSPVLQNTVVGTMVTLVGGITFLLSSLINISERNIKKVLAYSTVGNLGLIVACAGIGTTETVWVAILLIVFHAVAKSLLFLMAGTIEGRLASKDIENMDNLIVRMPRVTLLLTIGICSMFIAPFGIVVSKWAAIEAILKLDGIISPVMIVIIAYGSAATVFYWAKLLGKVIAVNRRPQNEENLEKKISSDEWFSEWTHAVLNFAVCAGFPIISILVAEPYLDSMYGQAENIQPATYMILLLMVLLVTFLPASLLKLARKEQCNPRYTYLSGRNATDQLIFDGPLDMKKEVTIKNYYLGNYFSEEGLTKIGTFCCTTVLAIMLASGWIWKS